MRTKLCTMAFVAAVLLGGSFAIKPAQAMPFGDPGVASATARLDDVEKVGCWWSPYWGRMVCGGPRLWGPRPYWRPRAYGFYGPQPWGPRWGYHRGW
jgi:hypothetical protein